MGGENWESEVRAKEDWLRSTGIAGLRKKDSFALDVDDKFVTLRTKATKNDEFQYDERYS